VFSVVNHIYGLIHPSVYACFGQIISFLNSSVLTGSLLAVTGPGAASSDVDRHGITDV